MTKNFSSKLLILILPVFSILFLFTTAPVVAYADNDAENSENGEMLDEDRGGSRKDKNEVKEDKQKKHEERMGEKCDKVEERIAKKISRFEENRLGHIRKYDNLSEKFQNIIEKLTEKGYDTSNLEEHLDVLNGMIEEYATLYSSFIGALNGSHGHACGESDGAFKEQVTNARELLGLAGEKRNEIREYYKNTIRQDIKELRDQVVERTETNDVESE